jgi:quinohemoprotein ethanol dehydrogenase
MNRWLGISCVMAGLMAGIAPAADTVVDDKYLAEDGDGANWAAYGRTASEQRYSPLDQINADNVKQLGWHGRWTCPTNAR